MSAMNAPRQRIDELDRRIVALLAERMDAVREITRLKQQDGARTVRDDAREHEVSRLWADAAREHGLPGYFAAQVLREVLSHSRRVQAGFTGRAEDEAAEGGPALRVAIQGGRQSYSDLALDRLLAAAGPGGCERLYLDSFTAAIDAVESGRADRALLPIENTIAGSLNEVYRLLGERHVTIVAEESLPIEHCLAAHPDTDPGAIRRILSHPVALQQCERFLADQDGVTAESRPDTARAAEAVAAAGRGDTAAICAEACARRLGLRIVRRDIADSRRNTTRFVLVAREPLPMDQERSGRTSLVLTVDNRQGSLARCLEAFAHRALNLSKLESRRRPGGAGEYMFYLDVDAWADEPAMAAALQEVRGYTNDFRLLGSYARGHETGGEPAAPPAPIVTVTASGPAARPAPAKRQRAVVHIGPAAVGGGSFALIVGPCAVENRGQVMAAAAMAREAGAAALRGGAFKPRTSPHAFQGLGFEGLDLLVEAGRAYDLPIVTEVLRSEDAERIAQAADCLQVGARNMQNFALLKKLGTLDKPVLLKRGLSASIDELLAAAEHITAGGNRRVILCERGIRTFETATRSTLDLSAVPVLKERCDLPVIVDPSHAAGRRELVVPLALAAVAAGADGLIVEAHPDPDKALCDGAQALTAADLAELRTGLEPLLAVRRSRG
jgi:3-deoxy-7-phosphoheptulonate synthase